MENPVIAADGHSYEREAITRWLQTGRMISPMTGEKLPNREIRENTTLKKTIQSFKDLLPQIQNNHNIKVDLEKAI